MQNAGEDLSLFSVKRGMAAGSLALIDVREPAEFAAGHIPGSLNVPLSQFDPAELKVASGKRLVFTCQSGKRAALARQKFVAAGGNPEAALFSPGFAGWLAAGEFDRALSGRPSAAALLHPNPEAQLIRAAHDLDRQGPTDSLGIKQTDQIIGPGHGFTVECDQKVAGQQPRFVGRAAGFDRGDCRGGDLIDLQSKRDPARNSSNWPRRCRRSHAARGHA